jgi:hypothetical protein
MPAPTAEELIRLYGLIPHPEGGYFRETYRSTGTIPKAVLPAAFGGGRHYSTAILFLLPAGTASRMHRLLSDELWHYHLGGALELSVIHPDGKVETVTLGPDVLAGQKLQHAVRAGCWFGALPAPGAPYCLAGATVAPGFDFADFQLGRFDDLAARFPHARELLQKLT